MRSPWGRLGPVGDATAMAANIVAVTAERGQLGAAARRYVLAAGYGWQRTFETLLGHYREAFAASRASMP